ncbi:anti-sigma factor [uncultured Flavobacterium sp.]|uniref:anti-sigma factor n=1 Tax=uncultured Flavobacterium sp. TaxID=165435 RepID=UPI0030ECFD4A|tara:strand:+ start:121308 stop:122090 length:783 start_codon:yes stop_codon:yes gene_type:complete
MTSKEYIESGILELYVFGKLSEAENNEVQQMMADYPAVRQEVIAIEDTVIDLSQSVAPRLSATNYEKIRNQILEKRKVIDMKPKSGWATYIGWAAAAVLVVGFGLQFNKLNESNQVIDKLGAEKSVMQESIVDLELKKKEAETVLAIVRDNNNQAIALAGQAVAPESYAKAYYNKVTKEVYVDVAGLPAPPEGKVYQVWALKLSPLTPTSIGVLDNFTADNSKVFKVDNAQDAEAFGITLEPAGGSISPTLEQLYTLGKV